MSAEMTFWHLRLPDKSKHHVHISQACVSFSLAVARDLLRKYCGRHWKAGEFCFSVCLFLFFFFILAGQ